MNNISHAGRSTPSVPFVKSDSSQKAEENVFTHESPVVQTEPVKVAVQDKVQQDKDKLRKLLAQTFLKELQLAPSDANLDCGTFIRQRFLEVTLKLQKESSTSSTPAFTKAYCLGMQLSMRAFHPNNPACFDRWMATLSPESQDLVRKEVNALKFLSRYPEMQHCLIGELISISGPDTEKRHLRVLAGNLPDFTEAMLQELQACSKELNDSLLKGSEIGGSDKIMYHMKEINSKVSLFSKQLQQKIKFINENIHKLQPFSEDMSRQAIEKNAELIQSVMRQCDDLKNTPEFLFYHTLEVLKFMYVNCLDKRMFDYEKEQNFCFLEKEIPLLEDGSAVYSNSENLTMAEHIFHLMHFFPSIAQCFHECKPGALRTELVKSTQALLSGESNTPKYANAVILHYENHVKLFFQAARASKGLHALRKVLESYEKQMKAIKGKEVIIDLTWLDEIDKKSSQSSKEDNAVEAVDLIEDVEEQSNENDVPLTNNFPKNQAQKSNWEVARSHIGKLQPNLTLATPKQRQIISIAMSDALYHFDVFVSACEFYQRASTQKKELLPQALAMLSKSSALVSEHLLTAQYFAENPEGVYQHTHLQMANSLNKTKKNENYLNSVDGCVVYHRYPHHAKMKLINKGALIPETLEMTLNPKSYNANHVQTFISDSILFFTGNKNLANSLSHAAIKKTEIKSSELSSLLQLKLRPDQQAVKRLIQAATKRLQAEQDPALKMTWEETIYHLNSLEQSISSMIAFPEVKLFAFQVEGILTSIQHIDELSESLLHSKIHQKNCRMHDLASYRKLRNHTETEALKKVVDNLNIETGCQYPHKRIKELKTKQRLHPEDKINTQPEAITLRLEAAAISRSNNESALFDSHHENFKLVSNKQKKQKQSTIEPSQVHQKLFTLLQGSLQMANEKIRLLDSIADA